MTREAEWDDQERSLRLAYMAYRAELCSNGHYLPDAADPSAEGAYVGRNRRCHACTAIAIESDRLKDNPQPQALLLGASRRTGVRRAPSQS